MSDTTISNTYQVSGYAFQAGVTRLDVTATGTIGGVGGNDVSASAAVSVDTPGLIMGQASLDPGQLYTIRRDNARGRGRRPGSGETLLLTDPAGFAAAVTDFGTGDKLDLRSFAPVTGEKASFTANAGDTGGTLKVTDGANAFSVALFGQYVASGFKIAGDGQGGSAVTYVPPPTPNPIHRASDGS